MNNHSFIFDILGSRIIKDNNDTYYCAVVFPAGDVNETIYIKLNFKLYDKYSGNEIYDFINKFNTTLNKTLLLINGIENFEPINEYYISSALAEHYFINDDNELVLPNLLIINNSKIEFNNEYWNYVEDKSINNYIAKNIVDEYEFTEDELMNLNSTFMKTILKLSTFDDYSVGTNAIYKSVIDFYANGQYDEATVLMNIILNGKINSTDVSNCGCSNVSNCTNTSTASISTGTDTVSVDSATCIDIYKASMFQWLKEMMSDTNFYCCWMFMLDDVSNQNIPNDVLLDSLIELLKEFLSLGIDLSSLGSTKYNCGCNHRIWNPANMTYKECPDLFNDSNGNSCTNISIIQNFIKVLNWVKENKIEENKNKIYIYGKQFAEIFPLLNFS